MEENKLNEPQIENEVEQESTIQPEMTEEELEQKKEYCGCLTILLPLNIFGAFIAMIVNITNGMTYANFGLSYLPIVLLVLLNIATIVALILLMRFKKMGLYIYLVVQVSSILLKYLYPDYLGYGTIFKSIFGVAIIMGLLAWPKNGISGIDHLE